MRTSTLGMAVSESSWLVMHHLTLIEQCWIVKLLRNLLKDFAYFTGKILLWFFTYLFDLKLKNHLQAYRCGKEFAFLTLACIGTYAAFTLSITQWR